MAIKIPVEVTPVEVKKYKSEYVAKLENGFKENICVDRKTGVYEQWQGTKYEHREQPTANGLVSYSY